MSFVRILSLCSARNRKGWTVEYVRLSAVLSAKILVKFGINIMSLNSLEYTQNLGLSRRFRSPVGIPLFFPFI